MFRYCKLQNPTKKPPYGSIIDPHHPLSHGLVVLSLMNEYGGNTAFDASRMQNHGALNSGCSWGIEKESGIILNGSSGYIDCGDDDSTLFQTNSFTLISRFIFFDNSSLSSLVNRGYEQSGGKRYELQAHDNYVSFQIDDNVTKTQLTYTSDPVTAHIPYFIAGIRDVEADKIRININGINVASMTDNTGNLGDLNGDSLCYGIAKNASGDPWYFLNGIIISTHIYNRALSEEEQFYLYNEPYVNILTPEYWYFCDFGATGPSNIIKVLNDTSVSSDVANHVLDIAKILNDTSGSSDAVNHALNIINILGDTADSSDAVNHVLDITRIFNDSAAGSDVINHILDIIKVFSDSAGSTDTFNYILDIVKVLNNAANSSDTVNHVLGIIRTFLDTADSSDTVNHALGLIKTIVDTAGSSDIFNHILDITKAFNDAAISSDTFNHVLDIVKILNETVTGSDTVNHVLGIVKTIVDTADSSDVVNHVLGLIKVFSDSANSSDTINHVLKIIRILNNTSVSSDTINHVIDIAKILNNAADSSDTLNHVLGIVRVLNDSAAGSDAVNHVLGLTRTIIDSAVSSDTEKHVISITGDILTALAEIKSVVDANNVLLTELWRLQGLDISNPMTVTPTSRTVGSISQTISGDGKTITIVTRN